MRIQSNRSFIHDPILHYKLDPGEPGIAAPKRASESVAAVATHEAANILRFRKEAIEKGGYVIDSFIGLNLQFKGSFLAAVSGKSKAIIIIPKDSPYKSKNIPGEDTNSPNNEKNLARTNNDTITNNGANDNAMSTANEDSPNKNHLSDDEATTTVDSEIQKVEKDKDILLQKLKNNEGGSDPSKNVYLKEKLHKLQARIQLLEEKKELAKQTSLLNFLGSQVNMPLNLILSKYKENTRISMPSISLNA